MDDRQSVQGFGRALALSGLLMPTGTPGLYVRSGRFDTLTQQLEAYFSILDPDRRYIDLVAPPVIAKSTLVAAGYVDSFPDLVGDIVTYGSAGAAVVIDADLALSSAVCHSVYPLVEGAVDADGAYYRISGQGFRHEPSTNPMRMLSFRQHETVYIGEPVACERIRDSWLDSAERLLVGLGLHVEVELASDPFFGRTGNLLASKQRAEQLKFELTVAVLAGHTTAIASSNLHKDHFGRAFEICTQGGGVAHSTCFAFGVERVALALLCEHGLDLDSWSSDVKNALSRIGGQP